jgi:hypothetical protein
MLRLWDWILVSVDCRRHDQPRITNVVQLLMSRHSA